MTTNRSCEELAMRGLVERWGRANWPRARLVHELVVNTKRIDMAFVNTNHLIGVEIKSSRDTLERWREQAIEYHKTLPEVWIAFAPKWLGDPGIDDIGGSLRYATGKILVSADEDLVSLKADQYPGGTCYERAAQANETLTVPMLDLLWRDELTEMCESHFIRVRSVDTMPTLKVAAARNLTGIQIIKGVCKALRARDSFPQDPASDPPITDGDGSAKLEPERPLV